VNIYFGTNTFRANFILQILDIISTDIKFSE
jgi:hypothetical protein